MPPKAPVLSYEPEEVEGYRNTPTFFVNGEAVSVQCARQARPNQTLLTFLREILHLTGSKLGCAEGGCGACTVMVSKYNASNMQWRHFSVNACLMPILAADGCHITTVEGVGNIKELHPVQKLMVDLHGSQCGFCTPGIIVSLYTLFTNGMSPQEHLDGNLCRCTGYRPIHDAAALAQSIIGPCGTPCSECPEKDHCGLHDELVVSSSEDKMKSLAEMDFGDSWKDQANKMVPRVLEQMPKAPLRVEVNQSCWIAPKSLESLLKILRDEGPCKMVVGNTEVGIETRFKHAEYPKQVYPDESITELYSMNVSENEIVIGACCPLSTIQEHCEQATSGPLKSLRPIHDMLRWFASTQIRNVACLGGNLVTASPISDMNPVLAALGAELVLTSLGENDVSRRTIAVSDFFVKYRTVDLKSNELVECVRVPVLSSLEFFSPFKQARRREDDISIVTSGQRIKLDQESDGTYTISEAALAYGGMAPTTVMARETAKNLIGAKFCLQSFQNACDVLMAEMNLPETVPGGQAAYRITLATSFLRKMFLTVARALIASDASVSSRLDIDPSELNSLTNFLEEEKPQYRGTQRYPRPRVAQGLEEKILSSSEEKKDETEAVGQAVPHASGALHCTGEAVYTDDIQLPQGTLEAALVLSSECGSTFKSIDVSPAMEIDGVIGVFAYGDILKLGGSNEMGPIVHDELVFLPPGEKIRTVGQVLGIVVAESLELAELGSRRVVVHYEPCEENVIVTVDDAIDAGSYYEFSRHKMQRGDESELSKLKTSSPSRIEDSRKIGDVVTVAGSFHSGAQEHFYLETNSSLVVPSDAGTNLTIFSSTQAPTKTQNFCASATGLQQARVSVKVKRMGGGFGGKETRSVFATVAAAVAAKRVNRPVRLTLARDVDMKLTGTRHAFKSTYTASAVMSGDGVKLLACDIKLYANGGNAFDLSGPVVDRALFHVDGCYNYPHFRAEGVVCKTVQPPHTAFRGFGGPQGMAIAEHIIDHLALTCGVSPEKIRRENMYKVGDHVPFGMVIGESDSGKWNVCDMWDRMYKELDVQNVRKDVESFNAKHKWTKRGFSMTPTKFGIAFSSKFMNQGGALVHLYTDGTVLVSHGGTEMGQGLHTKVCQVAAQAFNISISDVYIDDSSTDKVANTIPTAASMSTDLYGMATLDACRQILKRLTPIRERLGPDAPLNEVARTAHFERIDLSAHGFFAVDGSRCGFDWNKEKPDDYPDDLPENSWKGHPFNYFTQGVACTLVEIDVLSGNHKTLRADVLVDVGSSINPSIDIGQIEGAFIQGMGWSTIEEVIYACDDHPWIRPRGAIFTTGPGTYKIPAFNDVPEVFNVTLMDKVENPFAVHSSKAVGEPPFFLGASVFYAIKDAVMTARGDSSYFEMRMPASSERIRMYCLDELSVAATKQVKPKISPPSFQPQGTY